MCLSASWPSGSLSCTAAEKKTQKNKQKQGGEKKEAAQRGDRDGTHLSDRRATCRMRTLITEKHLNERDFAARLYLFAQAMQGMFQTRYSLFN